MPISRLAATSGGHRPRNQALKFSGAAADSLVMTKFFDKDIAAEAGHLVALELAALSSELHADMATMAAVRKAQGRPSLEEEEAENKAFFRELIDEGFELDPDVIAWALEG